MQIAVVGAGPVGLVTGSCLAEQGHRVDLVEADRARARALAAGHLPFHEPGLGELLARGLGAGTLRVHLDPAAVAGAAVVFLALPTPAGPGGAADLGPLRRGLAQVAPHLARGAVLAVRSTVPPGTTDGLAAALGHRPDLRLAHCPEFLREGHAVRDFRRPDRVVIGARDPAAHERLAALFAPFVDPDRPLLATDPLTAELAKLAANAHLAMRVAWIDGLATLAAEVQADIDDLRRVLAADPRIGSRYLAPGPGPGGPCLPKDLGALAAFAAAAGRPLPLVEATRAAIRARREALLQRVRADLPPQGGRVALWGLAFKEGTDDLRASPALELIDRLAPEGVALSGFDPLVAPDRLAGRPVAVRADPVQAAEGADVLVLLAGWPGLEAVRWREVARAMRGRAVIDPRGLLDDGPLDRAGLRRLR